MKTIDLLARIYRSLLFLYPEGARADVAADMEECFRDLCSAAHRDRGVRGSVGVALRTYAELPVSAWRARTTARTTMKTRGGTSMETFLQDVRYAVRGLCRNPGFTSLAVLSLAVGVGANTSMFSLASGVLWQELPVPEADRLVRLSEFRDGRSNNFSYPNFADVRDQGDFFEGVFLHDLNLFGLTSDQVSQIAYGEIVSADYFDVLRIEPMLGRFFDPSTEGQPESPFVTVLSHHLWRETFGADSEVVGSVIKLNARDVAVIGVAPDGFDGTKWGLGMDLWVPVRAWRAAEGWGDWEEQRGSSNMLVVGRLAPGSEMADANAGLEVIGERLAQRYPDSNSGLTFRAQPERMSSVAPDAPQIPNLIGILGGRGVRPGLVGGVRQRREPAPEPGCGPTARDRSACRFGCGPGPAHPSIAYREHSPRGARGHSGPRVVCMDHEAVRPISPGTLLPL